MKKLGTEFTLAVMCPKSGRWETLQHCNDCPYLKENEPLLLEKDYKIKCLFDEKDEIEIIRGDE